MTRKTVVTCNLCKEEKMDAVEYTLGMTLSINTENRNSEKYVYTNRYKLDICKDCKGGYLKALSKTFSLMTCAPEEPTVEEYVLQAKNGKFYSSITENDPVPVLVTELKNAKIFKRLRDAEERGMILKSAFDLDVIVAHVGMFKEENGLADTSEASKSKDVEEWKSKIQMKINEKENPHIKLVLKTAMGQYLSGFQPEDEEHAPYFKDSFEGALICGDLDGANVIVQHVLTQFGVPLYPYKVRVKEERPKHFVVMADLGAF